jgi:hypothetical protein
MLTSWMMKIPENPKNARKICSTNENNTTQKAVFVLGGGVAGGVVFLMVRPARFELAISSSGGWNFPVTDFYFIFD